MRAIAMLAAFLVALAVALPAAAAPQVMPRIGKWVVNYADNACHLTGEFGRGDDVLAARFTRYNLDGSFDLSLYGRAVTTSAQVSRVTVDFGAGDRPVTVTATNGISGKLPVAWLPAMRLDGSQPAQPVDPKRLAAREAAVTAMTVTLPGGRALKLELGALASPMKAMRDCQRNLIESWGYDPEVFANLSRLICPENNPGTWLTAADLGGRRSSITSRGIVQLRLDVSEAGTVTKCVILAHTDSDALADRTCRAVAGRARFVPALDAAGRPVKAYYIQKVIWRDG